ncbi:hypothetical protein J4233_01820 [Candidatus Pacearchaeota archaeon]|nr:hypothetical protein [Candidatus Pacearchaeota archaeon]
MNKKAFEMAISTLIIIILGILVLIAIIYAVTGGFKQFQQTTDPFTDTATSAAVTQACQSACEQQSKIIYCCSEYEIDNVKIKCNDPRLNLQGCALACTDFECGE